MHGTRIASALFGIALLSGIVLLSFDAGAEATTPDWNKGDEWSMGYELDIGETFGPLLDAYAVMSGEFESFDSNIEGKAGYFMVFKVAGETDNQYTLDINTGGGIALDAEVQITGDMPKEGTYTYGMDEWDYEPPMESKDIGIDVVVDLSVGVTGTAHFTKEGLMLQDLDLVVALEGSMDLDISNFPETDYEYDDETYNETMTVSYTDFDVSGSADVKLTLTMDFDPPLNLFGFPIEENEEWYAESNMTVSGTYGGTVDADGLPEELIAEMLEENIAFPITLEDLDTGIEEIANGVLQEQVIPVGLPMTCTGTETVSLADGTSAEAYIIEFASEDYYEADNPEYALFEGYEDDSAEAIVSDFGPPSGIRMLYCPEEGFFVSMQMDGEELGMDGIPGMSDSFEMAPMAPGDAQRNMGNFQKEISDDDDSGTVAIVLIAIVVIVAIVALILVGIVGIAVMALKNRN